MSANIMVDAPSMSPLPQLATEEIMANTQEQDERSSSLSEIGDAKGTEETEALQHSDEDGTDADDTEAETERLENSPLKQRKHQNVVLSAEKDVSHDRVDKSIALEKILASNDQPPQTSDISSGGELSEADADRLSTPPSTRKRKRSSLEQDSVSDLEGPKEATDETGPLAIKVDNPDGSPTRVVEGLDHSPIAEIPDTNIGDSDLEKAQPKPSSKQKYQKGKRKGKKPRDDIPVSTGDASPRRNDVGEGEEKADPLSSDREDVENEDVGDPEQDNAAKTEEGLMKKKTAMDSLSALEKCFATLRDRLFDERLSQANKELALLEQPLPIHPEFLAMKEVIDQRRDQKVQYEQTLLRLKLESLQRESIAAKHQVQSQYMQTVREIRDRALDQLNKEYYQVQRERRSCDENVPEYCYDFTTNRSQQIAHQRAHNKEISVLSGVAKYVGFPAAPLVKPAKSKEVEDDLRNMGIPTQPLRTLQNHPSNLRGSLSAAAGLPRRQPAAEEYFLEQNPWANPPVQYQQRQQLHRQVSALSGAVTPSSSSPALQKRMVGLTQTQGSASTIAEPPSGPSSSVNLTPATSEQPKISDSLHNAASRDHLVDATPSRVVGLPFERTTDTPLSEAPSHQTKAPAASKVEQPTPSIIRKAPVRDSHGPSALPKPLPFTQGSRSSTPTRFPVKMEDSLGARHSPISYQINGPPPVSTAANGHTNRFG